MALLASLNVPVMFAFSVRYIDVAFDVNVILVVAGSFTVIVCVASLAR